MCCFKDFFQWKFTLFAKQVENMKTILQKLFRIPVKIVSTISWSFLLSSLEIFVFEVHLSIRDLNWQFPREAPFQIFITPGRTRYWWNPRQLFEKKMVELTVSEDKIQITLRILGRLEMKMAGLSGCGKCMTLGDRCQVSSNSTLPPDIQIVTFTAFNCSYMCWPLAQTQLFCAKVSRYFFAHKHQHAFIYFWT